MGKTRLVTSRGKVELKDMLLECVVAPQCIRLFAHFGLDADHIIVKANEYGNDEGGSNVTVYAQPRTKKGEDIEEYPKGSTGVEAPDEWDEGSGLKIADDGLGHLFKDHFACGWDDSTESLKVTRGSEAGTVNVKEL